MAKVLPFPRRQSGILERLDVCVACMRRLQAAAELPAEEVRLEALGARIDVASLRKGMQRFLSEDYTFDDSAVELQHAWNTLEVVFEEVAMCATFSYSERRADQARMVRIQLREACREALLQLFRMRPMLARVSSAAHETVGGRRPSEGRHERPAMYSPFCRLTDAAE